MNCNNDWVPWLLVAYPLVVHFRTLLPPSASGAVGAALKALDLLSANYGNCKNHKPVDEQSVVTPRPEV